MHVSGWRSQVPSPFLLKITEAGCASASVCCQAALNGHCCKVSDEAAFCLIQRPYISKNLLTRRISPRGSP
ncbi:hypothetical protein BC497_28385 (plasmid) [Klebsiella variicola]|nr:hypothetical protein BC497_28385 [Klebsiella variicola]